MSSGVTGGYSSGDTPLSDGIAEQAERIRQSGALGRSPALHRLFDYLVQTSIRGEQPKEVEIALAVFGRDAGFDGAQDASVRVSVHRLRKKLEEHYAAEGRAETVRLVIPKGEYRLGVEAQRPAPAAVPRSRLRWLAIAAVALLLLNGIAWYAVSRGAQPGGALRHAQPWAELVAAKRPLILVIGDYYIFGETDPDSSMSRLVREYGINSHEDLDEYLMQNPQAVGRWQDLDLFYLPVGAAWALRDVMPVLAGRQDVRVVMASDLTSDMLRRNDIVYLGYLSGLSSLRDPVFAGSRFRIGDTWDELVDSASKQTYASQEGGLSGGASTQRDYGYVASFRGPENNRILVIAGTRDMGLMQAAEAATDPKTLADIRRQSGGAEAFEALIEAEGIRRSNLAGRLVLAAPLAVDRIWSASRPQRMFPAG